MGIVFRDDKGVLVESVSMVVLLFSLKALGLKKAVQINYPGPWSFKGYIWNWLCNAFSNKCDVIDKKKF